MRNIIKIIIFLLIPTIVFATPPSRQSTYQPNTTILSSEVTANENVIFNYLQAGVDTYSDASIVNADVAADANIQSDKLNLTSIAQNISNTGTFTNTGNVNITGTTTIAGTLGATTLASTAIGGGIFSSTGAFTTLEASSTFKLGTTNQGDILYDNGTSLVRLTPGTSGQFLKTNGSSANPAWADALSSILDYGTSASSSTAKTAPNLKIAFGSVSVNGDSSQAITNLVFTSSSTYVVMATISDTDTATADPCMAVVNSGSQFTLYNSNGGAKTVLWLAVGT